MRRCGKTELQILVRNELESHGFQLSHRNLKLFLDAVLKSMSKGIFEYGGLAIAEIGSLTVVQNNRSPQFATKSKQYRIRYKATRQVNEKIKKLEALEE